MVLCEISCKFFGGFTTQVDLNYMDSKTDICDQVKRTLITTLQINNLPALVFRAEKTTFHIHDFEFGQILMMQDNQKLWICNHKTPCDESDKNNDENIVENSKENPFNSVLEA